MDETFSVDWQLPPGVAAIAKQEDCWYDLQKVHGVRSPVAHAELKVLENMEMKYIVDDGITKTSVIARRLAYQRSSTGRCYAVRLGYPLVALREGERHRTSRKSITKWVTEFGRRCSWSEYLQRYFGTVWLPALQGTLEKFIVPNRCLTPTSG